MRRFVCASACAALLLAAAAPAGAQLFLASRPHPEFTVGPLFVRAGVGPDLGPVTVDVLWSLVVPAGRSAVDLDQDLFLLWPGEVTGEPGRPDPSLARYLEARGYTVLAEGRLGLSAQSLYQMDGEAPPLRLGEGAPFATFVRPGGALGLTAPATWIRIPWTPHLVNRAFIVRLRLTARGLLKPKPGSWVERVFWGPRHTVTLGFNDMRPRGVFPLYFEHRDRVVHLAEDPAQLMINFADADHLKIDEVFPPSSTRRLSETLDSTMVVSRFIDRSEGITPQVLTVQFGYFSGLQAWAPVLIPVLFFVLGNLGSPLLARLLRLGAGAIASRVHIGPRDEQRAGRLRGVVLPREALARIRPGETTYEEVLRLCGPGGEEQEQSAAPDRRTLVYRGRRIVPQRHRSFGWLATVSHWDSEDHEVEIQLERNVVRDVQARVRRARLSHPEPA